MLSALSIYYDHFNRTMTNQPSEISQELAHVAATLQRVWGYSSLRPAQHQVVSSLLQGRDCLAIMATGGGKSICFQLPALLNDGLTIVVSPLLALMEDQVQDLRSRNLAAACLHSNLSQPERRHILQNLTSLRLLYVSPETLLSAPVWERLRDRRLHIRGLMIDEAHCLVQWGDSFRPSYRRLGAVRSALMREHPDRPIALAAFTATADRHTAAELQKCLEMQNPELVRTSPYRPHLRLDVAIAWTPAGRKAKALKFIRDRPKQSGLIYVRSRRDAEEISQWLQALNLPTAAYHAGLPPQERRRIEQAWLTNEYAFVICTSAFGLGINKPDTRWVLHFHPPLTLSEYIQEIGRAGRDDLPAEALMLVSEPTGWLDDSDRQRINFFLQQQQKTQQQALAMLERLPRQGSATGLKPDAAIALGLLHRAGYLQWHSPFEYEILENMQTLKRELVKKLQLNEAEQAISQMQEYINLRGFPDQDHQKLKCNLKNHLKKYLKPNLNDLSRDRWAFLLNSFGFEQESKLLLESRG